MKKLIASISLIVALSLQSAKSQGYVAFQLPTRGIWDLFTPANGGLPKLGATSDTMFLWGTGAALITAIGATTPTNSLLVQPVFTVAQAWNAILNDSNYHLAIDGNTSANPILQVTSSGNASYNSAASFPLTGTIAGSTVNIYVIGWDKTYGTPTAAAVAGAAVGWSRIFQYALGASSIATVPTFAASGYVPFGVPAVPEPTTVTLTGLGMAAMLIARRRKQ